MGRKALGLPQYSLSNRIRVVICVDLERAVVGPEVYGGVDTRYPAFVDLCGVMLEID
jgi:hypothetical protein